MDVGFIGFGHQAALQHAEHLTNHFSNKIRIVAICDVLERNIPFVESQMSHLGLVNIPVYPIANEQSSKIDDLSSVERMIAQHPQLQAVIISTPPVKHYLQAK